jgi:hypothetical protein
VRKKRAKVQNLDQRDNWQRLMWSSLAPFLSVFFICSWIMGEANPQEYGWLRVELEGQACIMTSA